MGLSLHGAFTSSSSPATLKSGYIWKINYMFILHLDNISAPTRLNSFCLILLSNFDLHELEFLFLIFFFFLVINAFNVPIYITAPHYVL